MQITEEVASTWEHKFDIDANIAKFPLELIVCCEAGSISAGSPGNSSVSDGFHFVDDSF